MKRLLLIILLLGIYIISLSMKAKIILAERQKEVPTISKIKKKNGEPVVVTKVKRANFSKYLKLSGFLDKNGILKTKVPSNQKNLLNIGQSLTVEFDNKKVVGIITRVANETDLLSGLYPVVVKFENFPLEMRERIMVGSLPFFTRSSLVVPRRAILTKNNQSTIFVVNNGVVSKILVEISDSNVDWFVIERGVQEGTTIIISDQRYLEDREKVFIAQVLEI